MPILPFTEPIKAILADGASIGKVMAYGELAYEKGGGVTPEVYLFDDWNPEVTHTRNTEPKNMWAVSHNLSENKRSVLLPANVTNPNGVLSLSIKKEAATYSGTTTAYTSGLVYSKKAFGLGRTDVIANLCWNKTIKNSIWLTTSAYTDASTGKLLKLHEHDVVEWTCNDTKQYNTSRGMWMWQENKQSVGADRLPYIDFEKKTSLSPGSWWAVGNTGSFYQWTFYPVCRNGNRLYGKTTKKYYFLTDRTRGVSIPGSELNWICEDGRTGTGMDGNSEFWAGKTDAIGGGAVKSQFLDGTTPISGWHKWSIVMDNSYVAYLCDDREYWRSPEPLYMPDDIKFSLIFATNNMAEDTSGGTYTMQVRSVTFTPKG